MKAGINIASLKYGDEVSLKNIYRVCEYVLYEGDFNEGFFWDKKKAIEYSKTLNYEYNSVFIEVMDLSKDKLEFDVVYTLNQIGELEKE